MRNRPSAAELLERDGALIGRPELVELGLSDYDVDRLMRAYGAVVLPGVRRSYVASEAARSWIEEHHRL